jgi:glycosyltransferase involved in cell wall biosynthesis
MSPLEITPVILTFNEEANIRRTLERLTWARRIVVVDSNSTDATVEMARAWPQVSVVRRAFTTHEEQWNFALDQSDTDWVLSLDADYVLSKELITELQSLTVDTATSEGYYARFRYCIEGRPLRGSLYPPRIVLFRRRSARYENDGHTQRLHLDGQSGWLSSIIYHDDRKPLDAWLAAQSKYSKLEAAKLNSNVEPARGLPDRIRKYRWIAPLLTVFYCLFARGLILDGKAGLIYTLQRTYAELLLSLRLLDGDLRSVAQNEQKLEKPDGAEPLATGPRRQ